MLSFAAGVMLAAAIFSLLIPAIETAETLLSDDRLATLVAIGGLFLGAIVI